VDGFASMLDFCVVVGAKKMLISAISVMDLQTISPDL